MLAQTLRIPVMRKLAAILFTTVMSGSAALHAQQPGAPARLQQLQVVALQRFETEFRKVQTTTAALPAEQARVQWRQFEQLIASDTLLPGDVRLDMMRRVQGELARLPSAAVANPVAPALGNGPTTPRIEAEFRRVQAASAALPIDQATYQWRQLQLAIDRDTLLSSDVRRSMTQRVQEQIVQLSQPMGTPAANPQPDDRAVSRDAARREAARVKEEASQIRAWLGRIAGLHQAGQLLEAERQSLEMSRLYPDNAAAQTMNRRAQMNVRLSEARDLVAEQEKRANAVFIDVQEASLPVVGDVEFPKDWKEKSERRTASTLTAKEQAIMKSLESPINIDYRNKPFVQLIQELSDGMKLPIILDKQALSELEVDSSTMATLKLTGVSTRTALRKLLSDYGLVYVIKNESILVTSQQKAKEMLVTRVYYLGDLVRLSGPFSGAPRFGPVVDELQTQDNARVLLEIIQTSIDPNSWRANGGLGTLTYHAPTASLIVRQSAEVHALMGSKFAK